MESNVVKYAECVLLFVSVFVWINIINYKCVLLKTHKVTIFINLHDI